jgi:hypothetical protein
MFQNNISASNQAHFKEWHSEEKECEAHAHILDKPFTV